MSNFVPAPLWSASTASGLMLGEAPAGHYFKLLGAAARATPVGGRPDHVWAGVCGGRIGGTGRPPPDSLVPARWWGYVGVDDINVRAEPTDESTILGTLAHGLPVVVESWIDGEEVLNDQPGWAKLGEGVFIYGPLLRKARIETPPPMPSHGPLAASLDRCQPHAADGHRV